MVSWSASQLELTQSGPRGPRDVFHAGLRPTPSAPINLSLLAISSPRMFGLFDDMFGDSYYDVPRYCARPSAAMYPQYRENEESSESADPLSLFGLGARRRPRTARGTPAPIYRAAKVQKPAEPDRSPEKPTEVVTDGPSEDCSPSITKPKLTNREADDAPEIAFRTYSARNTIAAQM